jgi:hypothetical protein
MNEMSEDLEGHYRVQESKIVNHPEHWQPVLMTRYGWAKRGHKTKWYETKIEPIEAKIKEKNT